VSKVAKAYSEIGLETSVKSSNPRELLVLVFERINDHLALGKEDLLQGKPAIESFTKAVDLINLGLLASIDKDKGGDIAKNLEFIYLWVINKIIEARLNKAPEKIDEAMEVLRPIHDGWRALSDK